ncbi:MAG: Flp pilus assembly complex ATPase component TadA [Clostridia bacterium]|nr:Flp pilus assembly complex ATPase component TadA [Clostridia bacterium]
MEFDNAIFQLAEKLQRTLQFIPDEKKLRCEEIRLRSGLPVCLTVDGNVVFVCRDSTVKNVLPQNPLIATKDDIEQTLSRLCNKSVYMHEEEIKQGFVALNNGCRAGVCGMFNAEGMLVSVTSINIRIARQVPDCARDLLPHTQKGLLIAGPPGCGKTTILRDTVRLLSNGVAGNYYRVAVIDSRGEISGGGALDIGPNTDVLYTRNKASGTQIALRTLYPDYIVFDEIGTNEELLSVCDCFNAGVRVITTAHVNDLCDVTRRNVTKGIISSGAIEKVALISNKKVLKIIDVKELFLGAAI